MNNLNEQDLRFIKKRIVANQWLRSVEVAVKTTHGYEAMPLDFERTGSLVFGAFEATLEPVQS